jgi:3-oxoacyl-[acyl-carrier protein] reductase
MSKFELQDKTAIVTGGAGAIGSCIAMEYARAGANIVVADRDQANFDKVTAEIKALGRESLAVVADVTVPEQVDNMVKQVVDTFGRVDVLVNCAGAVRPCAIRRKSLLRNGIVSLT